MVREGHWRRSDDTMRSWKNGGRYHIDYIVTTVMPEVDLIPSNLFITYINITILSCTSSP